VDVLADAAVAARLMRKQVPVQMQMLARVLVDMEVMVVPEATDPDQE